MNVKIQCTYTSHMKLHAFGFIVHSDSKEMYRELNYFWRKCSQNIQHYFTHGIFNHVNAGKVPPPQTMTVTITMMLVVVSKVCRASDAVFRIAKANAIAPRKPEKKSMC